MASKPDNYEGKSANQKALSSPDTPEPKGVGLPNSANGPFGPVGDSTRIGTEDTYSTSPGDFGKIGTGKVPARTKIPVAKSKTGPAVPAVPLT